MKKHHFLLSIFIILIGASSSAQTVTDSFTFDGLVRDFRVHLPPSYNFSANLPLVLNLHGRGSNAFQQEVYTQFNSVADTAPSIVVYANAINAEWNVNGAGVDDVGFLSALIDTIDQQYNIDLSRVYSIGMSMGGYMSYRLACEQSCRIAAIASVTGLQAQFPCTPSRPVPVLQIHGTDDPTVPYSQVNATIQSWVQKNNCPTTPVITNLPDINTADSSTVTVSYYGLCDDSTQVILYTINNGEHTWPSAFIDIGITNKDINGNSTVWNFLKQYWLKDSILAASGCDTPGVPTSVRVIQGKKIEVQLSPNPTDSEATLTVYSEAGQHFTFSLFDVFGKEVKKVKNITTIPIKISTDGLLGGIYLYQLSTEDGVAGNGKIIIRN